jgi:hemimethylated DNA binding protein
MHEYIHQKFIKLQRQLKDPDHHPNSTIDTPDASATLKSPSIDTATMTSIDITSRNHQNVSMERVFTLLNQIPIMQYDTKRIIVSIQSITDVQQCIRAVYRLNALHVHHEDFQNSANSTTNQLDVEKYEKECRNIAFEEMKHMNEISVELQKCHEQRHQRLHHEFRSLQNDYDDFMNMGHVDKSCTILPVGQVVQHKTDRWRGVVVHWSCDDGKSTTNHQRTKVRDDFTSLTLKSYTTPIEDKKPTGDDPISSSTSTDQYHFQRNTPYRTIVYEIAMDVRNDYEEYHDGGDNESSSSSLMKRHLLPAYDGFIPTFITIRQPLFIDQKSNIDTGVASPSSSSVLDVLNDPHISRVSNPFLRQIFKKFDSRTNTYVPKSYMNYTYPQWYPTINTHHDDSHNSSLITHPNQDTNELTEVEITDPNLTKIMSDMIQQIQSFALHLVSIINTAIGTDHHRSNESISNNTGQHKNPLMDVITELRTEILTFASLDSTNSYHIFKKLPVPLSRQLSLQLSSIEYVATKIIDAMYKRRRNKGIIGMIPSAEVSTNENSDIVPQPHNSIDMKSMSENEPFSPKFRLGQIVRHKKYNFRGVIVGRDSEPIYNVTRWDGLRDVPNAKELPFYNVIPDQQDCIEIFGGERPSRYVCEVNLEPCPSDQVYLDVDVDADWIKLPDGSYRPPPFERFKYGYDSDEYDTSDTTNDYSDFEKCMMALESEINQWHCESSRFKLLPPPASSNDVVDDATKPVRLSSSALQKYAISIHDLMTLLKASDNVEDAMIIRDTIKLFGKAHPNIQLRSQLQYGIDLMVADNCEKARKILLSMVTNVDPTYIDAWNYLANSENFLSLRKDALESANRALELNQNDFQAYTQLGILHFQQGEYGSAEVYFRMCLDLDPWSIVSSKLTECIDLKREKESE